MHFRLSVQVRLTFFQQPETTRRDQHLEMWVQEARRPVLHTLTLPFLSKGEREAGRGQAAYLVRPAWQREAGARSALLQRWAPAPASSLPCPAGSRGWVCRQ